MGVLNVQRCKTEIKCLEFTNLFKKIDLKEKYII